MSTRAPGLIRALTRFQIKQFRSSSGTKGNKVMGKEVFILDVVGRKSAVSRPVMLMLVRRGDELVAVGSHAGAPETPNWFKNLMAAGEAHVEVGSDRWAVTARQAEGDERDECWAAACAAFPEYSSYQELTERVIPLAVLSRRE